MYNYKVNLNNAVLYKYTFLANAEAAASALHVVLPKIYFYYYEFLCQDCLIIKIEVRFSKNQFNMIISIVHVLLSSEESLRKMKYITNSLKS